jgi:protein-S-isoprenylcysteine O-methyltransferase Ste14
MDEREGRAEPFVAEGPYRFTRNPMYFGVSAVLLGAGALLESSTLVVWGALMAAFFWWYLIPFEERELSALFGEGYRLYAARVPKMLPYRKGYDREG